MIGLLDLPRLVRYAKILYDTPLPLKGIGRAILLDNFGILAGVISPSQKTRCLHEVFCEGG